MVSNRSGEGRPNQCIHVKRNGERCKRTAQIGLDRCSTPGHGATFPSAKAIAAKARQEAVILRSGYSQRPVPEGHAGANPVTGLAWELRRTAGNIIYLEERIANLQDKDIIWGRTLEEVKDAEVSIGPGGMANDASYTLQRDEAQVNLWVGLSLKERAHYKELCKIAIAAGFEDRRIRMQEEQVLQINNVLGNIISALGKNPDDPEIRRMVRNEMVALVGPA